VYIIAIYLY